MPTDDLLIQINYYCKRLGFISTLAFRKESLDDVLEILKQMDSVCIEEEKNETKS